MLTSFHVIFLKTCDLNLHLEIGFFNACLVLDSLSMTKDISGGHVFFTYLQPLNPVNIQFPAAQLCMVLLQKLATRRQQYFTPHRLSLSLFVEGEGWSVNSLLFSIGIQWISDVFVSGYRNSIQLHTDIYLFPFRFFFAYR